MRLHKLLRHITALAVLLLCGCAATSHGPFTAETARPCTATTVPPVPAKAPASSGPVRRILVVEQDPDRRHFLMNTLTALSEWIGWFDDGHLQVQWASSSSASSVTPAPSSSSSVSRSSTSTSS